MNTGGVAKKVRDSYDTLKSVYGSAIDADKFNKWNRTIKAAEDDADDTAKNLQEEWCGSVDEECPAGLNKDI